MKLSRMPPNGRSLTREASERARAAADASRWHVGPAEGVEADRHRSAQEETRDFQERALAPSESEAQMRELARALAKAIAELGPKAAVLLHPDTPLPRSLAIDDKA